jgi:hypothetical protein
MQREPRVLRDPVPQLILSRRHRGGSGRYVASLLTDKTGAPVIKQPVPLGPQIEVTVTKDTPDGRYQAVVVDAASERKVFFEIVVTK